MERLKESGNGEEDDREGREKTDRIPLFYLQPEGRDRDRKPGGAWSLEYRKYALSFGYNVSGRRQYIDR